MILQSHVMGELLGKVTALAALAIERALQILIRQPGLFDVLDAEVKVHGKLQDFDLEALEKRMVPTGVWLTLEVIDLRHEFINAGHARRLDRVAAQLQSPWTWLQPASAEQAYPSDFPVAAFSQSTSPCGTQTPFAELHQSPTAQQAFSGPHWTAG